MFGQGGASRAIMGVIVTAIIAVFILEFRSAGSMPSGSIRRECAIKIDGACLTPKDYYAAYGLVVPRGVPVKQVKALGLRRHVLDGLIERELLVEEAERLGLSVDEEAAKKELRMGFAHVSLPAKHAIRLGSPRILDLVAFDEQGFVRDGIRELPILDAKTHEVDDDLYGRVVRSVTNRSPKEFLKMQQREVLASRMRDLVRSRVRVSEQEAFDAFERDKSKAVARFVRIDPDWFARWSVDPTDALADKYASEHKTELDEAWKAESAKWKAECPLVSEILVAFDAETATEAEKTEKKDKIQNAKALLDKGTPFADVARQTSEGPTATGGGALGCLLADTYGEGADVVTKAVEGLTPGAVSGVLESKRGYHIVKLDSRLAAADVETVGRRSVARPLAVRDAATSRAKEFGARLIKAAQGGARLDDTVHAILPEFATRAPAPKKAKEGAEAAESPAVSDPRAPKAEVSAPFGVDDDPVPGAYGAGLGRLAFGIEKPDDVYAETVTTMNGLVVLQLKEKTMATRDEFKTAKPEFTKRLEIEKRSDALARFVGRLRQDKQAKIEISDKILEEPKASSDQD